ncbi:MAG: hypothetical protein MI742_10995 [Desulfobacterales bacterium]|nr:hypothetical protein [Desulfobacterales bacterium]
MKISTMAVIMAMTDEAKPFIEALELKKLACGLGDALPMEVYTGSVEGANLIVVVGGKDQRFGVDNVATQPATLSAYLAIEQFKPDLLINAGTAGGFKAKGAEIGDVYIGSGAIRFHDRRIPIPGFDGYGVGSYKTPDVDKVAEVLGLKKGVVSTGNSLDMTPEDQRMIEANQGAVKEMEAAAIAWVAELYDIPLVALKAITDLVDTDTPTQDEFMQNLKFASERLQKKLTDAVHCFAGEGIA